MIKKANISLDDFELALKDITDKSEEYDSIFNNSIFTELKKMHDKYGAKFSCFCFSNNIMDISTVTTKFRDEFASNSNWLRFGFHGTDYNSFIDQFTPADFQKEYEKAIRAIIAFTGEKALCKTIRLHGYRAGTEIMNALYSKYGITGMFCADDNRISYDLTPMENDAVNTDFIYRKNGLIYYKTNLRYEYFSSPAAVISALEGLKNRERLVLFTHDYAFADNLSKMEASLAWLNENKYEYNFFNGSSDECS